MLVLGAMAAASLVTAAALVAHLRADKSPSNVASASAATANPGIVTPPPLPETQPQPQPALAAAPVPVSAPPNDSVAVAAVASQPVATRALQAGPQKPLAASRPATVAPLAPFQVSEARTRLSAKLGAAASCKATRGGSGFASVVFAPAGNVSGVTIDAPFTGTPEGNCIAGLLRGARVAPFSGTHQVVRQYFRIP